MAPIIAPVPARFTAVVAVVTAVITAIVPPFTAITIMPAVAVVVGEGGRNSTQGQQGGYRTGYKLIDAHAWTPTC